jgi:hypothetical protein
MDKIQDCEVCGVPLPEDTLAPCECVNKQDAIWYVNGGQCELVRLVEGTRLSIERVGYTKFIYYPANYDETGETEHLLDTADFEMRGIDTDQALSETYKEGRLEIEESPWFEIYDTQAQQYLETPTFVTLDEAYAYVIALPDNERKWTI